MFMFSTKVVDRPRSFGRAYPPGLSARTLSETVVKLHARMLPKLPDIFRGQICTLCMDGGTDINSQKQIQFVAVVRGKAYWVNSEKVDHADAPSLKTALSNTIKTLRTTWGLNPVAVVADNASAYQV